MAMKKFALTSKGNLVYKATGKAYRGAYTTKVTASGVVNVYGKDGRKIGSVSKANKTQQAMIDKLDKRRKVNESGKATVAESKVRTKAYQDAQAFKRAIKEAGQNAFEGEAEQYSYDDRPWMEDKQRYDVGQEGGGGMLGYLIETGETLTFEEQKRLNFAKVLDDAVNRGEYTKEYASELWEQYNKYMDEGDDYSLSKLWSDIILDAEKYGLPPSD